MYVNPTEQNNSWIVLSCNQHIDSIEFLMTSNAEHLAQLQYS